MGEEKNVEYLYEEMLEEDDKPIKVEMGELVQGSDDVYRVIE